MQTTLKGSNFGLSQHRTTSHTIRFTHEIYNTTMCCSVAQVVSYVDATYVWSGWSVTHSIPTMIFLLEMENLHVYCMFIYTLHPRPVVYHNIMRITYLAAISYTIIIHCILYQRNTLIYVTGFAKTCIVHTFNFSTLKIHKIC